MKAASIIYRAKFAAEMERCGLLAEIPKAVWQQHWVVNSQAVGDGRSSLKYLAPYVFRVAIGNATPATTAKTANATEPVD